MKMPRFITIAAAAFASAAWSKTVYIAPNGDNANDGLSSSAPVKTLKEAYTKANAAGDVIQFLDGIYTTENFPEATDVKRNISIQGNPSDRTAVTWDMSGSEIGDGVVKQGDGSSDRSITIKDITFCNSSKPGMVYLINAQIAFEMSNCVLRDSSVRVIPFIFPKGESSYTFTDVEFKNISSSTGACIIGPSTRTETSSSSFAFLRCHFEKCGQSATKNGGCFWNPATGSSWVFDDCRVSECYSVYDNSDVPKATPDGGGSGAFFYSGVPVRLIVKDSNFANNVVYGTGGAFRLEGDKIETEFTGCTFTGNRTTQGSGGAVSFNQATQTNRFFSCTFERNWSESASGGGIYADRTHTLQVSNCTFKACAAKSNGGALAAYGPAISIEDSVFEENTCEGSGAALHSHYNGTQSRSDYTDLHGCTFVGNVATVNGAGAYLNNLTASVSECIFRTNRAVKAGGVYGGGNCSFSVTDCLFDACAATHASNQADGGAIWLQKTADYIRIARTQFLNCSAKNFGGAVYAFQVVSDDFTFNACRFAGNKSGSGSAFYRNTGTGNSPLVFRNSLFEGNLTSDLGGKSAKIIAVTKGTTYPNQLVAVENCTFAGNLTGNGYVTGSEDAPLTVRNTIFWGNEGNGKTTMGRREVSFFGVDSGLSTFANNISEQDLVNADASIGSVNADPLFVQMGAWSADAEGNPVYNFDGDYTLAKRSPARDAGARLSWMTAEATDFLGNPRVSGSAPDLGAYEFKPTSGLILIFR